MVKNWIKEHKILSIIFTIIFFIIVWIIWVIAYFIHKNKNQIQTERINISEFSSTLEMKKEWKVLSYPEIEIISNIDWEVLSLDVSEWDIVEEWQVLMQIWDPEKAENSDVDIDAQLWRKYVIYYEKEKDYNEFQSQYWEEISTLERKILDDNRALNVAIEVGDEDTKTILQKEIQDINQQLKVLKDQRDMIKSEIRNIENEIQITSEESLDYYYEQENHTLRATIQWIIWNIYVKEWDKVEIWDKLATIVDNSFSSEVAVWLDFNEYLLTKDLSQVFIVAENENWWDLYYDGEIYSRSPILNDEWTYTVIIRFLEDVWDLVLNDENTKITVIFPVDSDLQRLPERCFTWLSKNNWTLVLRDGNLILEKEIWIKNRWDDRMNIDNFTLFSLEKEEEKDAIELSIEGKVEVLCNIE